MSLLLYFLSYSICWNVWTIKPNWSWNFYPFMVDVTRASKDDGAFIWTVTFAECWIGDSFYFNKRDYYCSILITCDFHPKKYDIDHSDRTRTKDFIKK